MAKKVVEGADDLVKAFGLVGQAASVKVLRRAIGKSLRPTARKLRAAAPRGTVPHKTYKGRLVRPGFLRRNISVTTRAGRDKNRAFGNLRPKQEAWYGSLLEHGWRPGKRSRKVKAASKKGHLSDSRLESLGDARAKVPGNKWWSNAYQGEEEKIIQRFADIVFDEISKEWAK